CACWPSRSVTTTRAPSAAYRRQIAAPMPRAPPVTIATLSLSFMLSSPSEASGAAGAWLERAVEIARQRLARPQRPGGGKRRGERLDVVGMRRDVAEDVAHVEPGARLVASQLRLRR